MCLRGTPLRIKQERAVDSCFQAIASMGIEGDSLVGQEKRHRMAPGSLGGTTFQWVSRANDRSANETDAKKP